MIMVYLAVAGVLTLFLAALFYLVLRNQPQGYMTLKSDQVWIYRHKDKSSVCKVRCFRCDHPRMKLVKLLRVKIVNVPNSDQSDGTRPVDLIPHGRGYFCNNCRSLYKTAS